MTQLTLSNSLTALLETKTGAMPPISTAESPPTFASLTIFQRKFEANATALPSTDNELGCLGLVTTEADYVAEEGHAYAPPADPGNEPTTPVLTAAQVTRQAAAAAAAADPAIQPTAFTVQEAMRRFQQDKDDYRQHVVIKTILKNQVISSVHDTYIEKLKKKRTGFAKVTAFELLEHLWKTYSNIDDLDLTENEARMKAPWNEPTPIEDLFKQLNKGQEFAAQGKEIIADTTLTREGYNIILATGLFSSACRKWQQLKETKRTWSKFQDHFKEASRDRKHDVVAEEFANQALHQANFAQAYDKMSTARLAAMFHGNTTPPTDASTPAATPMNVPASEGANIAITVAQMEDLITKLVNEKLKTRPAGSNTSRSGSNKTTPVCQGYDADKRPVTYCHTHGITKNLRHTSMTCTRPSETHNKQVTLNDRKGSLDKTCEKRT
jgi:hypothetical protein